MSDPRAEALEPRRPSWALWLASELVKALEDLPSGTYLGANRYDTDDEHVLHLWRDGQSWDLRVPRKRP